MRCSVFCPDQWLCSFSPDLKAFLIAKFTVLLFHKLYDNPATLTDTLHKRVYQSACPCSSASTRPSVKFFTQPVSCSSFARHSAL